MANDCADVKSLEKVCSELIDRAKSKDLRVKGMRHSTRIFQLQAQILMRS